MKDEGKTRQPPRMIGERVKRKCFTAPRFRFVAAFFIVFFASRLLHLWHTVESFSSQNLIIQSLSYLPPNNKTTETDGRVRNIVFVHVGKAAGETVKYILKAGCLARTARRKREKCLARLPDSRLSNLVSAYFHCFDVPKLKKSNTTSFLFNVRHPVDRALSWYGYIHPDHCKYKATPACVAKWQLRNEDTWIHRFFECFPTAEEWILPKTSSCREIAQQAWKGSLNFKVVPLAAHMIANYQHYVNNTINVLPDSEILVVRTTDLWHDLKALDEWLGGTGRFGGGIEGTAVTHGSHRYANPVLNATTMRAACCALLPELSVYRDLLAKAANLDQVTKELEMKYAVKRCGSDSWEELEKICIAIIHNSQSPSDTKLESFR